MIHAIKLGVLKKIRLKRKVNLILILIVFNCFILYSGKSFTAQPIEDEYEENDSLSEAKSITSGLYKDLCQADEDWYKISIGFIDKVPELHIKLFFDIDNTSLNFTLYDGGGQILRNSTNQNSFLVIECFIFHSNTFYLQVNGPNNGDLYDLDVVIRENEDGWEPNDIIEEAWKVGPGKYTGFHQYDDDWFFLHYINENIHKNDYIRIEMDYNTEEYLEIEFTNENGTPYHYQLKEKSWGKLIEWTAEEDNLNLYIHVYGNSTGVAYELDIYQNDKNIPGYQIEAIIFFSVFSLVILVLYKKRKKIYL